jgi:three-Cys-motif partner protein
MKEFETISPHTAKKVDLVSSYAAGWARKLLKYEKSKGIVYIDCMSNCGKYISNDGGIIEGTAIRVARMLDTINKEYKKEVILYFNDISSEKIEYLENEIVKMQLSNVEIFYHSGDANQFLKELTRKGTFEHNTLLFYDPYTASIDWEALIPFLNTWGEVIINHMLSDPIRGTKNVIKSEKIGKYEMTYQKPIEELAKICCQFNNREALEELIKDIISDCVEGKNKRYYIASFPFYIRTNQLVYNLIYFSWSIFGMRLFKEIAWKTFDGQSSIKHITAGDINGQICMDFDTNTYKPDTKDGVYTIYDVAKYINKIYNGNGEVTWDEIFSRIDCHPIFPSDGFRNKIKYTLKNNFNTINKRNSVIFRN